MRNKIWFNNIIISAVIAAGVGGFSSCKKSVIDQPPATLTTVSNNGPSAEFKMKDSVLKLSRDLYLWYDKIPSTFNAQSYATPVETMTAIRTFGIEAGFTATVDRWSFAMKKTEWDNSSTGRVQEVAQ